MLLPNDVPVDLPYLDSIDQGPSCNDAAQFMDHENLSARHSKPYLLLFTRVKTDRLLDSTSHTLNINACRLWFCATQQLPILQGGPPRRLILTPSLTAFIHSAWLYNRSVCREREGVKTVKPSSHQAIKPSARQNKEWLYADAWHLDQIRRETCHTSDAPSRCPTTNHGRGHAFIPSFPPLAANQHPNATSSTTADDYMQLFFM